MTHCECLCETWDRFAALSPHSQCFPGKKDGIEFFWINYFNYCEERVVVFPFTSAGRGSAYTDRREKEQQRGSASTDFLCTDCLQPGSFSLFPCVRCQVRAPAQYGEWGLFPLPYLTWFPGNRQILVMNACESGQKWTRIKGDHSLFLIAAPHKR